MMSKFPSLGNKDLFSLHPIPGGVGAIPGKMLTGRRRVAHYVDKHQRIGDGDSLQRAAGR